MRTWLNYTLAIGFASVLELASAFSPSAVPGNTIVPSCSLSHRTKKCPSSFTDGHCITFQLFDATTSVQPALPHFDHGGYELARPFCVSLSFVIYETARCMRCWLLILHDYQCGAQAS